MRLTQGKVYFVIDRPITKVISMIAHRIAYSNPTHNKKAADATFSTHTLLRNNQTTSAIGITFFSLSIEPLYSVI